MAQRKWADVFGNPGDLCVFFPDAYELLGCNWFARILAGKQSAAEQHHALARPLPPPGPQYVQQVSRQNGVAITSALAAFNADQHARVIDVAHKRHQLGNPQACAIGDRQGGTML